MEEQFKSCFYTYKTRIQPVPLCSSAREGEAGGFLKTLQRWGCHWWKNWAEPDVEIWRESGLFMHRNQGLGFILQFWICCFTAFWSQRWCKSIINLCKKKISSVEGNKHSNWQRACCCPPGAADRACYDYSVPPGSNRYFAPPFALLPTRGCHSPFHLLFSISAWFRSWIQTSKINHDGFESLGPGLSMY